MYVNKIIVFVKKWHYTKLFLILRLDCTSAPPTLHPPFREPSKGRVRETVGFLIT